MQGQIGSQAAAVRSGARRVYDRAIGKLRALWKADFDPLGSAVAGWNAESDIALRETDGGYAIFTTVLGGSLFRLSCRSIALLLSAALWPAGLSLVLAGMAGGPGPAHWQKVFLICVITLLGVVALTFRRKVLVNDVRIDLKLSRLNFGALRDGATLEFHIEVPFEEVEQLVIQRPSLPGAAPSLILRRRGSAAGLVIARGNDATLLALHDRLNWDLTPVLQRLSGLKLRGEVPKPTRRKAFVSLAPAEITV